MARQDAGQPKLQVEYVPVGELAPYAGNAKEHPEWQVSEITESIKEFGFSDPIGAWHDPQTGEAVIVEGHGRLMAAKELGMERVPVVWLDHLDDEGRRAYGLVHNKLTMDTDWDDAALQAELDGLKDMDMSVYGFDEANGEKDDEYSKKVDVPLYEPSDKEWELSDIYDTSKADEIEQHVENAAVPDDVKDFLRIAATRFVEYRYDRIADYYARSSEDVKRLMEDEALIIIDYEAAVQSGFARLSEGLEKILEADYDE